ncbi:hypothetical protein M2138_000940 [Dysgonomonadaceae bacterium PH5-43]|nr:hypothetical protein [Dysgonomonadaceae bacterium PH5-43]
MNSLIKKLCLLILPLLLVSCNDDDNYLDSLYSAIQGTWLVSTSSYNNDDVLYTTQNTFEFQEDGNAYDRTIRYKEQKGEETTQEVVNEIHYTYLLDIENHRIYLNINGAHTYTCIVTSLTAKKMEISILDKWNNGKKQTWTRM